MIRCPDCAGTGEQTVYVRLGGAYPASTLIVTCSTCDGVGRMADRRASPSGDPGRLALRDISHPWSAALLRFMLAAISGALVGFGIGLAAGRWG